MTQLSLSSFPPPHVHLQQQAPPSPDPRLAKPTNSLDINSKVSTFCWPTCWAWRSISERRWWIVYMARFYNRGVANTKETGTCRVMTQGVWNSTRDVRDGDSVIVSNALVDRFIFWMGFMVEMLLTRWYTMIYDDIRWITWWQGALSNRWPKSLSSRQPNLSTISSTSLLLVYCTISSNSGKREALCIKLHTKEKETGEMRNFLTLFHTHSNLNESIDNEHPKFVFIFFPY